MIDTSSDLRDKHKHNIKMIKDFVAAQKPELDAQMQAYLNLINENTISIANVLLQTNVSMQKKLVTLLRQAHAWDEEKTTKDKQENKEDGKESPDEEIKTIHIKQYVMGALQGTTGYVEMASTPGKYADVPELLENKHGQNKLSPDYASLFWYFIPWSIKNFWIAHVQWQHNGRPGRMYDTRIFYEINAPDIRTCDYKIGKIVNSLPRMRKYPTYEKKIWTTRYR